MYHHLKEVLSHSRRLVVFTGAGLSADSGVSTFRDKDGLWENHSIDKVCNGLTWKANFDLVHRFYNERRVQLATVEPNEAHRMIVRLQDRFPTVNLTQNVDDLLERAGSTSVFHLHGKLREIRCEVCGSIRDIGHTAWVEGTRCGGKDGKCTSCKGMRPNVVFFHEAAPEYVVMNKTLESLTEKDVLLVIGTSGAVIDISRIAAFTPATSIICNLESAAPGTGHTMIEDRNFEYVMHGRASERALEIEQTVIDLMSTI